MATETNQGAIKTFLLTISGKEIIIPIFQQYPNLTYPTPSKHYVEPKLESDFISGKLYDWIPTPPLSSELNVNCTYLMPVDFPPRLIYGLVSMGPQLF